MGWVFVLSNCELGTSHVCWESVYSQCGGMMTELGELHQRILAAQARIQHNIVRTPVLRSAQSQHIRA